MKTLVTGASSGIGKAVADQLDGLGWEVARTSHDWTIGCYQANLRDTRHIKKLHEEVGEIECLVNCAGVNYLMPIEDIDIEKAREVMDVNFFAGVQLVQEFLPGLKRSQGVVCSIVSNASEIPMTHSLIYNASKAAQAMGVEQMAHELTKKFGITVFGISPAKVANTRMSDYIDDKVPGLRGWTSEEARAYQMNALKSGQELQPNQVAEFTAWLLADRHRSLHLSGLVMPYGS